MSELKGNLYEGNEAWIEIYFSGFEKPLEFLLDTGFNGSLCLPNYIAQELNLEIEQEIQFSGIGNHQGLLQTSRTSIEWFGEEIETSIIINDGNDFLIGTKLLEDKELYINYKSGEVVINHI